MNTESNTSSTDPLDSLEAQVETELERAACPKCARSWSRPCEQSACIDFHGECMVCRFGIGGTGTAEEAESIRIANIAGYTITDTSYEPLPGLDDIEDVSLHDADHAETCTGLTCDCMDDEGFAS